MLWTLAVLVLLVALLLAPRFLRQAATTRRWRTDGDPAEAAWAELRASAIDLGVAWPTGRSPRAAATLLQRSFGAPLGPDTPARPETGARTNPEAVEALGRIVQALEESRYSPAPTYTPDVDELRSLVGTCVSALQGGATSQARLRATWLPASVLTLRRRLDPAADRHPGPLHPGRRRPRRLTHSADPCVLRPSRAFLRPSVRFLPRRACDSCGAPTTHGSARKNRHLGAQESTRSATQDSARCA